MDERVVQFRVGVMVFATLIIVLILLVMLGETPELAKRILQPTETVRLWFPEARGIRKDSLVRRQGILIGRVTKVEFAGQEPELEPPKGLDQATYDSGVVVTTALQSDKLPYEHDVCTIETDLLGKPSLHFVRAEDMPATTNRLDTNKVHRGQIALDPLDSLSAVTKTLAEVTPGINNASQALETAAKDVSGLVIANQFAVRDAVIQANQTLGSIATLAEDASDLIGDRQTQDKLKAALKELPDTLNQMRTTLKKAQDRLDEMQAFTEELGSDEMIRRLEGGSKDLEELLENLAVFSAKLRDPQGSLGLLLRDRRLYDHLDSTAENIDDLSRQLKPILNDVRVFTDKIARHPERLGARGALQRYPGVK